MPNDNDEKFRPPTVYVATPVQWLPTGQRNDTPVPALVADPQESHGVTLRVFQKHGPAKLVYGVVHIEDPQLQKRNPEARAHRGAWRLVPGLMPKQRRPLSDEEKKVLRLIDEGKTASETAAILGGAWTHQRVGAVVAGKQRRVEHA